MVVCSFRCPKSTAIFYPPIWVEIRKEEVIGRFAISEANILSEAEVDSIQTLVRILEVGLERKFVDIETQFLNLELT